MITNMAQLKRFITVGTRMHVQHHGFKLKDGSRTPEKDMGNCTVVKVQTNALAFATTFSDKLMWSWWGKAADIRFNADGYTKLDNGEPLITYTFLTNEENSHGI